MTERVAGRTRLRWDWKSSIHHERFSSEAVVIEEQARQAQPLKHGENLLQAAGRATVTEKETKTIKIG